MRSTLALLLLRANHLVHVDSIIEELWGSRPPRSAVTAVQTYVWSLRKVLAGEFGPGTGELLATQPPGYVLHTAAEQLDASAFGQLVQQSQLHIADGQAERAVGTIREALDIWTGPALQNVPQGSLLRAHASHLEEQHISALELQVRADMKLGRHRQLVPELRSLTGTYPLHEWFHGQLIAALSRCGRRGDALHAYDELRELLSEELGVDPSPSVQRIQRRILCC